MINPNLVFIIIIIVIKVHGKTKIINDLHPIFIYIIIHCKLVSSTKDNKVLQRNEILVNKTQIQKSSLANQEKSNLRITKETKQRFGEFMSGSRAVKNRHEC